MDRSSRPKKSPRRLTQNVVLRIERLRRRRHTGLEIAMELNLAVSTVSLWLRRLGLGRLKTLEPKPVVVRYEKKRPGELVHLDTKKLGRIQGIGHRIHGDRRTRVRGIGWEFLHVCVDDATRVAYAEVLPDERAVTATGFLERALASFRERDVLVERVMTDNGSCYRSHRFRRAVVAWGARQIYTRPYRPQTNGKAERFIQTAKREWAYRRAYRSSAIRTQMLRSFLNRYNRRRPHRALGIRHVRIRPYRPQTNGKAERFIQTMKREWAYARAYRNSAARARMLPGFLDRYNRRRPHRGIGNATPLSRLEALV